MSRPVLEFQDPVALMQRGFYLDHDRLKLYMFPVPPPPPPAEAFPIMGGGYYPSLFAKVRRLWQGWRRRRLVWEM